VAGLGFIGVIFGAVLMLGIAWLVASTPSREPLFVGLGLAGAWWGVAFGFMTFGAPDATGAMLAEALGAAAFGAGLFLFVGSVLWAVHRQDQWPAWLRDAMHPSTRWSTRHVRAVARRLEPLLTPSESAPAAAAKPARAVRSRPMRRAS
jgi:hypothetical protein